MISKLVKQAQKNNNVLYESQVEKIVKDKSQRKKMLAERSLQEIDQFKKEMNI